MRHLQGNSLLILLAFLLIFSQGCKKKDDTAPPISHPIEELNATGILGTWEIQYRHVGQVFAPVAICCEYLTFETSGYPEDLVGALSYTSSDQVYTGSFTLSPTDSSLIIDLSDEPLECQYELLDDLLKINYIEDGQDVEEGWLRGS